LRKNAGDKHDIGRAGAINEGSIEENQDPDPDPGCLTNGMTEKGARVRRTPFSNLAK
jgi:hypothetical protein